MSRPSYAPLSQTEYIAQGPSNSRDDNALAEAAYGKPPTYNGEGSFDPPSSLDGEEEDDDKLEEQEILLTKRRNMLRHQQSRLDLEQMDPDYLPPYEGHGLVVGGPSKDRKALKYLLLSLVGLVGLAAVIGMLAATTYDGSNFRSFSVKPLSMDHIFNGTFSVSRRSVDWVAEAGDGVFSTTEGGNVVLKDLKTNTSRVLVERKNVKDEHGSPLNWNSWRLSADMKYLLIKTDERKQWRHSRLGNYYIYDLEAEITVALTPPTNPPLIAYAAWSPTGDAIAFVKSNDLYIVPTASSPSNAIRVTSTGNSTIFNGVPDWVYEEEVFADDHTLWWSPDSTKVAFVTLDETKVDVYSFPIYNPSNNAKAVYPYTRNTEIKYPKPGYANPLASLHVFELDKYNEAKSDLTTIRQETDLIEGSTQALSWDGRRGLDDSIITEVVWVANKTLIVKEVNRSADDGNVVLFDFSSISMPDFGRGRPVRKLGREGEQGDGGWIDSEQTIYPLPATGGSPAGYLDIVPTPEGYNHIALFTPVDSGTPRWLTYGEWEVTGGIKAVDRERGLVYFTGTTPSSSMDRHVFAASLPTSLSLLPVPPPEPKALTDVEQPSYYSASFSPEAGFYLLNYDGPYVPWQKVVSVANASFQFILTDNARLNETSSQYQMPIITRQKVAIDDQEFNVMELRPPSMDESGRTKYPVLFHVYGGPFSQTVNNAWNRDWHHYLACNLKYIVVKVDGRGTGFKGRKFRNPVSRNLGYWETQDQISAARYWATKRYVDTKRIGIWGWSYGGFMASKVVEANAGIHSLAMSVAPVTSWRLYDSIYTERYMGLPAENPDGYVNASIADVSGFRNANFLLAHGSGDDNVHFANSAHLLDMLTQAQVRGFWFRMFTDSDHGIGTRGAYRELHEWMTSFLLEKWGKGAVHRTG